MPCRERGMALVSILFLLALMTAMAMVLTEKVWQSSSRTARAAAGERVFRAAGAGIEWARVRLAVDYRDSGGWQSYLSQAHGENYPLEPALATTVNDIPVELFLRDNADGDGNVHTDSDLRIYLLARACAPLAGCRVVEALCGLGGGTGDYGSNGGSGSHSGVVTSLPELAAEPRSYGIED